MNDLFRSPLSMLLWWGVPLLIGFDAELSGLTPSHVALTWSIALAWMGVGCLRNALRCGRLHCWIAGPVFLLGAIAEALVAFGVHVFGPHAENNVASAALVLAILSFVPESVWGRYLGR